MKKQISPEKRLEWEEKFQKHRESGLSVNRWCLENQISKSSFNYWKERLYPRQQILFRSNFVELSSTQNTGIVIECRGLTVRLDRKFDSSVLKQCLTVLMQC